jgi:hypothetical protein
MFIFRMHGQKNIKPGIQYFIIQGYHYMALRKADDKLRTSQKPALF